MLVFPVVPWHRADGGRRCHWLLLLLPGGQEFTHHGVLQEPRTSGLELLNLLRQAVTSRGGYRVVLGVKPLRVDGCISSILFSRMHGICFAAH